MKLLLFSDLHCNARAAACLVDHSRTIDVLVGAGDFATVRRDLPTTVDVLRNAQKPTVLVPGNAESFDELRDACGDWPEARVLHGTSAEIDGVTFYGVGGGIPVTPFGAWSYDFTEEQATDLLAACPVGCILVTHSPPKGAVDVSSLGRSLGSTAIRATIESKRPLLAVCGHIHESGGREEWIGSTPVINAGPRGVEWELRKR
jgi:Icc-related predicted phosphoesterase